MIWKDIPGYEGIYQVSDCGKVKSLRFGKEKILKYKLLKGYERYSLYKDGVEKFFLAHRLVIYAFDHIDENLTVNHIDEDKRNNHISNLEYCTLGENVKKFHTNNPRFLSKKKGHAYIDRLTSIIYDSVREIGRMMVDTGQAEKESIWRYKVSSGKQDRFIKIQNKKDNAQN